MLVVSVVSQNLWSKIKWMRDSIFDIVVLFRRQLQLLSPWKITFGFSESLPFWSPHSVTTMPRHSLRSICVCGVLSEQPRRLGCFHARISVRLRRADVTVINSYDVVSSFIAAASIDSSLAPLIRRTSTPLSNQVLNELAKVSNFLSVWMQWW